VAPLAALSVSHLAKVHAEAALHLLLQQQVVSGAAADAATRRSPRWAAAFCWRLQAHEALGQQLTLGERPQQHVAVG
jgi:hypothetical protein